MTEPDTGAHLPLRYHQLTKHTPKSVRSATHRIDWMDQPEPFKWYLELDPISLGKPTADTGFPAALAAAEVLGPRRSLNLAELTRVVGLAAGVRRVRPQPTGKPVYLRSYASAGALYPIEAYIACSGVEGLEAGLYHYSPPEDALRLLRPGDPRPYLLRSAAGRPSLAQAPITVILSGIPWRTNWKYRARGYRHLYWDAGMILANLLALCASGGHPSEVVMGFLDEELDSYLGIDGHSELSICMVPIGFDSASKAEIIAASSSPPPIDHPVGRLSFNQREYQEVTEAHTQTSLRSYAETQLWQKERFSTAASLPPEICPTGIERVIRRRGSKRRFQHLPIPRNELEGIIAHSTYSLACDWGVGLIQVGLIANAVDGLEPGAYAAVYGLAQIDVGDLRAKAKFLCLEQDLGGDAAATLFLMADLEDSGRELGSRGYRAAQLNAGIVAGRIYLCAYACGFGATGLTFYDDEVSKFFHTEAEPMLVVALGH